MKLILALIFACLTAFAGEFTTETDVDYCNVGGKRLLLDVHRPVGDSTALRPAVIFVHGGGWVAGDKKDMRVMAEAAARQGAVAFNINYRLVFGRENIWPAPLDDVQRAVRWVRKNAPRYGVDPEQIGALGGSAGGHLVLFLGLVDTRDNSDADLAAYSSRVKCVVDLFGPSDLTQEITKVPMASTANDLVRQLIGGPLAEKGDVARDASPLFRIGAERAAFLIWHGRKDSIVPPDQSERMHEALKKAGADSTLVIFEDEDHGWRKPENNARFAKETLDFLKKHLQPAKK
jgi:acetyl esterase/lipase